MIASVAFRNFKALRAARIELAPFNLVIGPNGSGKTSLIQALLRLRSLARLPLSVAAATRAEGPEIVFNFAPPHDGITARMACVSDLVCDFLEITPQGAPGWPELLKEIGRIRSYLLDHYAMVVPASQANAEDLASNGANLAAVLARMQAREPAAFAALTADALRLMPEFIAIDLAVLADKTVELAMVLGEGAGRVAAEDLSQGTLYLLAMLALTHDPKPPTLVCIEEIDRGIHPRLLREVRDTLYRLSYPAATGMTRAPVQVIATTHSPYLLDLFRDHPEEVVISQKRGRAAHFSRLADRADLPELLREGSLGDMWFTGVLGGVPEEE